MVNKTQSTEKIVQTIVQNLIAHADEQMSVRKANACLEQAVTAIAQIRAQGESGYVVLLPLLDHPHAHVRMSVAISLLSYAPDRALAVLREIPDVIAQMAVRDWLKFQSQQAGTPVSCTPTAVSRETLATLLHEAGLERVAAKLIQYTRPSLRLKPQPGGEGTLECGASKFGGTPDFPPGYCWPCRGEEPMAFLLQLRLAEVAPLLPDDLLPSSGMLYLFYDGHATGQVDDDEVCRVIWWDGVISSLQSMPWPEALPDELRFAAHPLCVIPEVTLLSKRGLCFSPVELTGQELHAYAQVIERVSALQDGTTEGADRLPRHLLFGHPDPVRNDVIADLVSDLFTRDISEEEYAAWQLVLQIDSDPTLGMEWGVEGRLYFCMRTSDLLARKFERMRVLNQSYSRATNYSSSTLSMQASAAHVLTNPPTAVSCETLAGLLHDAGLERVAAKLIEYTRPSLRLKPQPSGGTTLGCGASKFGGTPDLPPGYHWPCRGEGPMAFLLQIRLAEMAPLLPDNLLPASGMLYLFYDGYATDQGEDDEACRVFWWDGALASLQNTPYPEALPDELRFTAHSLRFTRELTLPPVQVLSFVPLELTDQERLSYAQVIEHISALQDGTTEGADRLPRHLLLGHPDSVQNDVIEELVSDAFTRDVSDEEYGLWQLVLQIDSDPALGMEWDDMGRLYICMRTGDLSARRFERARLLKQSY